MATLLAGVAGVGVGGCRDDGPSATLGNDRAVAGTVDVRASGCGSTIRLGTGGVIDTTLIVTAAHVVAGAGAIEVIDATGQRASATVVLFDPSNDVAALRTPVAVGAPTPVRTDPARAGEIGVVVISRLIDGRSDLQPQDVSVVRAVTIRTTDIYQLDNVERTGFELSASIEPGDSGTMVHLPGGGAGIVWAKSTERSNSAWAVRLPGLLFDAELRGRLVDPVDAGACVD